MITLILIALAGLFNSIMDTIKIKYNVSLFTLLPYQKWINPSLSHKNKWKFDNKFLDVIFSTVLVFITDLWHFSKMCMLICLFTAVKLHEPIYGWLDIGLYVFSFGLTFEIFWSFIWTKKFWRIKL